MSQQNPQQWPGQSVPSQNTAPQTFPQVNTPVQPEGSQPAKARPSLNSGLLTWSLLLINVGVLFVFQSFFIRMEAGVFFAVLFATLGVSLIVSAVVRPRKNIAPEPQ